MDEICNLKREHMHVGESNLVWLPAEGLVGKVREDGTVFHIAKGVKDEPGLEVLVLGYAARLITMS